MRRFAAAALVLLAASAAAGSDPAARLVRSARAFAEMPTVYDSGYRRIAYPGGDPGGGIGVCTDLVIRSYRALGIDLQRLVHQDISKNWRAYPAARLYAQTKPDPNIDHRRVPNLMTWFARHGQTLPVSLEPAQLEQWRPGDIVVFDLVGNNVPSHIGIVSDRKSDAGLPLVFHHFPPLPREDDCLRTWKIIGHYRYYPAN